MKSKSFQSFQFLHGGEKKKVTHVTKECVKSHRQAYRKINSRVGVTNNKTRVKYYEL